MLDVLLIPAALLLVLALQAVRRGDHRLHGHLMLAAFTVVGLRLVLYTRDLLPLHLGLWLTVLAAAASTLTLGRKALAWREGRSNRGAYPRLHRASGALTLLGLALVTVVWLLRHRG